MLVFTLEVRRSVGDKLPVNALLERGLSQDLINLTMVEGRSRTRWTSRPARLWSLSQYPAQGLSAPVAPLRGLRDKFFYLADRRRLGEMVIETRLARPDAVGLLNQAR